MLLPWLTRGLGSSDAETIYYASETGQQGDEYVITGPGNSSVLTASEQASETVYRFEPAKR